MIETKTDAAAPSLAGRLRRFIEARGPYQSLALLLVPTSLVEPLKLVAVVVAGDGHWITGGAHMDENRRASRRRVLKSAMIEFDRGAHSPKLVRGRRRP